MNSKILVVDDELDICEILRFNLENNDYDITIAESAEEALNKDISTFDLILLDVMMGGMSGFKMAERLRKDDLDVPIIFLTAKDSETDMLKGFSIGADDYITKPFSVKEVVARVNALLKRSKAKKAIEEHEWVHEGLKIYFSSNRVILDDEETSLTKKEFEILKLLVKSHPNVQTREDILSKVWEKNECVLDRTVDVHITRLRKKLRNYANIIGNRSGFGYYLNIR